MDATRTLQRIIDSNYRLAALETPEIERLLALFKRLTLSTGRAVYHWTRDNGLYRLGIEHIFIPRTRAPADVLAYVSASRHYGIYLLDGFNGALGRASIQRTLSDLSELDDDVRRLVILIGTQLDIPQSLRPRVAVVRHNVRARHPKTPEPPSVARSDQ